MTSSIVADIKGIITQNLSHVHEDMAQVCIAIVEHVSVGPSQKQHLTFTDLHRISPKVEEDVFYEAVFYLTRKNINVLTQQFEALTKNLEFEAVPDREQILEDMRNEEFYNPFTGIELSEEEFGNQVLIYFSPSIEFVSKLNG